MQTRGRLHAWKLQGGCNSSGLPNYLDNCLQLCFYLPGISAALKFTSLKQIQEYWILASTDWRTNGKDTDAENFGGIAEVLLIMQVSSSGFDDALITSEFERLAHAFVTGAAARSLIVASNSTGCTGSSRNLHCSAS
ncbi:hypothetical protein L6164_019109 [Bauhinia variegata]|uniref:Uncharacterized protein n=1 Tax=Bauhinia variegata TaxID=167791 RepID=A0ACB9NEP1_BAUVA|nr:hypothetical protein L6164_019109 [Bauhinia variegata]